jgi:hypothetical protein
VLAGREGGGQRKEMDGKSGWTEWRRRMVPLDMMPAAIATGQRKGNGGEERGDRSGGSGRQGRDLWLQQLAEFNNGG